MGRGNWRATNRSCDSQYSDEVYVEIISLLHAQCEDDWEIQDAYTDFKDRVEEILPSSYVRADRFSSYIPEGTLFYNRHVAIVWDTQGDIHHQGIGVRIMPGLPEKEEGLAEHSARATFKKLKEALCKSYACSVWTSPWTTQQISNPTV